MGQLVSAAVQLAVTNRSCVVLQSRDIRGARDLRFEELVNAAIRRKRSFRRIPSYHHSTPLVLRLQRQRTNGYPWISDDLLQQFDQALRQRYPVSIDQAAVARAYAAGGRAYRAPDHVLPRHRGPDTGHALGVSSRYGQLMRWNNARRTIGWASFYYVARETASRVSASTTAESTALARHARLLALRWPPAGRVYQWLLLVLVAAMVLYPVSWLIRGSFWSSRPGAEGYFTLENYAQTVFDPYTWQLLGATFLISGAQTVLA